MSAPQHIGVGAPTGRISGVGGGGQTFRFPSISALGHRQVGSGVGERTCRLPSKLELGSRGADRSAIWRWGADLSASQHIAVGEPTGRLSGVGEQNCRLPSKLPLGSRQVGYLALGSRPVGSPANCCW